jgi:CubicO group peptidase (beta-lactamase class C family)
MTKLWQDTRNGLQRPGKTLGFIAVAVFLTAVIAILAVGPTAVQNKESPADEQFIQRIQNGLMPAVVVEGETPSITKLADSMAALHVPGVSVAVIRAGKIEWARGFGVTKVGGPPVTPETLFQAGSISKPVAAVAVLRLAESGKLNLDADVNQYLKTWKVPGNEFTSKRKVTLRELLTHTAGVTVHGFPGYAAGEQMPTLVQVLNGEKPANTPSIRVDTEPGTIWRYSGGGFVIVQQLLEDFTGKPFPELMQQMVLEPMGMVHSAYQQPLPPSRLDEAATPYDDAGKSIPGGPHTYPEMAPAGLWTTPSDLGRFALELQRALTGKSKVLSSSMVQQMLTPGLGEWGLGIQVGGSKEAPYFAHDGVNDGYVSNLVAYDSGDGVVVMTNAYPGGVVAEQIVRTVASEYKWPDFRPAHRTLAKIDPTVFDRYVGAYQLAPNFLLEFRREADRFFTQATGQSALEIFPESDHEFFAKDIDIQISFVTDSQGRANELILHQNGDHHALKVPQAR